jgi:hypothetical protein
MCRGDLRRYASPKNDFALLTQGWVHSIYAFVLAPGGFKKLFIGKIWVE